MVRCVSVALLFFVLIEVHEYVPDVKQSLFVLILQLLQVLAICFFLGLLGSSAVGQLFVYLFLQVVNISFEFVYLGFHLLDLDEDLGFVLFSLESLAHSVRDRTFVQGLVGLYGHFYLVSNSDQEETTLGTVDGNLPYDFVKTLGVQLFSNGTDACLTCLSLL